MTLFKKIFLMLLSSVALNAENHIELRMLKGAEVASHLIEIADLQRIVFREYPHFYVGSAQEYYEYAAIYNQPSALACLLYLDEQLIAAVTGIAFKDMFPAFKKPFYDHQIDISKMFFLGELVILKEYRGKGYGTYLLKVFEQEVIKTGLYDQICLCTMDESEVCDKKPADFISKDTFWQKQGYVQLPEIVAVDDWIIEGADATSLHRLIFWIKVVK